MKEAAFYIREGDGVRCVLCPHGCVLREGDTGRCRARSCSGGRLVSDSYGKVSSVALDPVEKKPLRRFCPGTQILSLGSFGCNMCCPFCQNHAISAQKPPCRSMKPEEVAELSLSLVNGGNIGVAYTYNEPLVGYEFVLDCARLVRKQGQRNVLVTNGLIRREPLERLLTWIDAVNIDLKSFNREIYTAWGGDLEQVRRSIELAIAHCHVEVTVLAVPGCSDDPGEMDRLAGWLASLDPEIPLHVSRYFPRHHMRIPATPVRDVRALAEVARARLRYVYEGNC